SFFFAGPRDTAESTMKFEFNPRDGIDNPALSLAEDSGAQVRFCFLKKEDGESFGFWLRQEVGSNGHIVRQVRRRGLAHRRGLQDGDRILEVERGLCRRPGALQGEVWLGVVAPFPI
uniref:PDZ domain-containing protein n=1 Tax=Podarcis muralis TaxID=64176 RepID=A0A670JJI2_PODMU